MRFTFTHPSWLLLLLVAIPWTLIWLWRSDVQVSTWRRWTALGLRLTVVVLVVLALAGLQWLRPIEGMNVFFLLDRSDSIPPAQQEAAREFINRTAIQKKKVDRGGVLVFGTDASIEAAANPRVDLQKVHAVVGTERTDIAGAVRLGTAAFPEDGQKRLVLLSDGNENIGDAMASVLSARPLGVTVDVFPLGVARGSDVSVQKLALPNQLKKGQTFEVKIFAQSDDARSGRVRLYRNEQLLGEERVELAAGKNLFVFPQTLNEPGFYSYDVVIESPGDMLPQNNRATSFTSVRGDPRVVVVSSEPSKDQDLAAALRSAQLEVKLVDLSGFPATLAEMQSYDTIFLSNIAAGDLGNTLMRLLESAVRDFGVGLVCLGGDQAFAAGGYRGTPLESTLPVEMELSSKKVLPSGALVIVCHATEFPNGNQWARDIAFAALDALGPQDEMGIVLWDGRERWVFPLGKVGNKSAMGNQIMGMNPGDMIAFGGPMEMAHEALQKSKANLKHMVVFSDGDPSAPGQGLVDAIVKDRITISTVMIGGHVTPETMEWMASAGRGRFYDVRSPGQLPQIFLKEAAVILKSAIFEEPFKPQVAAPSEVLRGIGAAELPALRGYVATTQKSRAETPILSDKGDPILAHWQYGLGRAVAFTSDARAKWGQDWLTWGKYRQFWTQVAKWSLRRVEDQELTTDVSVEKGEGVLSVEALDTQGGYRNFMDLQAVVVSPKGESSLVRLEQTGPGHYEARFPTREVGAYLINLLDMKEGKAVASQRLGAAVNYSPEFASTEPNHNLLRRLAESGGGRVLNPDLPSDNPFLHDRVRTQQPNDLWEWLLRLAILLFPLDVGVRRIYVDKAEWLKATETLRRWMFFWKGKARTPEADESLAALLTRRDEVRSRQTRPPVAPRKDLFRPDRTEQAGGPELPSPKAKAPGSEAAPGGKAPEVPAGPATTTDRLLEAKRRAQGRKG
jgi:uncharacterized membrane protein